MSSAQKPTCFVISPIGEKDSETRKHCDQALKYIFKKALSGDYKVIRADKISQPGMITSQILQAVQDSPLVLADLSEHNPNVFYELAVRHALEKPIIHVIDVRWSIPFDVGHFRTIKFDLRDPDSIHNAVKELKDQAEQVRAGNWGETPVKLANIMRRTMGDTPEMLLLKQAVEGIADVSARLESILPVSGFSLQDLSGSYANAARSLGRLPHLNSPLFGIKGPRAINEPSPMPIEQKAQSNQTMTWPRPRKSYKAFRKPPRKTTPQKTT
jgi:hypothetical protein